MQLHISPSLRHISIYTTNGFWGFMKGKGAARHVKYRNLLYCVLIFIFLMRFVFILAALASLDGTNDCTSLVCIGKKLGPGLLGRTNKAPRLAKEIYEVLQAENVEIPEGLLVPDTFENFVADLKANQHDARTFGFKIRAMVEQLEQKRRYARMQEILYRHIAASSIPKGLNCLSLRLADEYSSNAKARKPLPSPELVPCLIDNSYQHFVLATDNVLAASVVVSSAVRNSVNPERIVFHVITDKKTYAPMHAWFSLHPLPPAIIEVKGLHQFKWMTKDNIPVLNAMKKDHEIRRHYDHDSANGTSPTPTFMAAKLQAQSPKYFSIMNHIRIYLPELFPDLQKVVFLDDDVVIQSDLSPLWDIDLHGKVNGAVETCRGDDSWVMSKRFRSYFNFSHPLIAENFDPEQCAWAYGMNILDLQAWRKTNIRENYHFWLKKNLDSNLRLWRMGTLPPALIAFNGLVHPIDQSWHMLGLGYQPETNFDNIQKAAVIHYNGRAKPWLDIAFPKLRPLWAKYVDFSDDFIKRCNIVDSELST
ncbi:hypothetical protein SUGI_0647510 [Cryptomeria japonica]|uniref:probable galacturonosyltransferase 14 n=1 Tax=Cryptomeria japonica TaxID=3369 RepID=UPI0024147CDE|nr:probable galacturonosyltransferase 14 [Cryptomeria japonica]GLJ32162.1 hypothetical protein SUGI_0647510 [Cryptomeria japonica]